MNSSDYVSINNSNTFLTDKYEDKLVELENKVEAVNTLAKYNKELIDHNKDVLNNNTEAINNIINKQAEEIRRLKKKCSNLIYWTICANIFGIAAFIIAVLIVNGVGV